MKRTSQWRVTAAAGASLRQYTAPRVLGMISEKNRISSVSTAEAIARISEPQIPCAWAPTPAAPTVWAIVFRLRIAASGRSTSAFMAASRALTAGRSSRSRAMNAGVTLSSTASSTEQRKEKPRATRM